MKRKPKVGWCPQCGPLAVGDIDGDGCCDFCGATADGQGARKALRLLKRGSPARDAVVRAAVKWATLNPEGFKYDATIELVAAVAKLRRGK